MTIPCAVAESCSALTNVQSLLNAFAFKSMCVMSVTEEKSQFEMSYWKRSADSNSAVTSSTLLVSHLPMS